MPSEGTWPSGRVLLLCLRCRAVKAADPAQRGARCDLAVNDRVAAEVGRLAVDRDVALLQPARQRFQGVKVRLGIAPVEHLLCNAARPRHACVIGRCLYSKEAASKQRHDEGVRADLSKGAAAGAA